MNKLKFILILIGLFGFGGQLWAGDDNNYLRGTHSCCDKLKFIVAVVFGWEDLLPKPQLAYRPFSSGHIATYRTNNLSVKYRRKRYVSPLTMIEEKNELDSDLD